MINLDTYKVGSVIKGTASIKEAETTPPSHFTEGDIIKVMDDIGRYAQIGAGDMAILRSRNDSGKAGIGTARTRGEIVKKLFSAGFLSEKKIKGRKVVVPTEKGLHLYDTLNKCGVAKAITSPEITARWEEGLLKIERGEITAEMFMSQMREFVRRMVHDIGVKGTS